MKFIRNKIQSKARKDKFFYHLLKSKVINHLKNQIAECVFIKRVAIFDIVVTD